MLPDNLLTILLVLLVNTRLDEEKYLDPAFCNELKESLVLDLFNKTPAMQVAEALMGTDNVLPRSGALLAVDASEKLANLTSGTNIQLQPGALVL